MHTCLMATNLVIINEWFGVFHRIMKSEQCYDFVTAVLFAVLCYIGQCYDKTDMYIIFTIVIILHE